MWCRHDQLWRTLYLSCYWSRLRLYRKARASLAAGRGRRPVWCLLHGWSRGLRAHNLKYPRGRTPADDILCIAGSLLLHRVLECQGPSNSYLPFELTLEGGIWTCADAGFSSPAALAVGLDRRESTGRDRARRGIAWNRSLARGDPSIITFGAGLCASTLFSCDPSNCERESVLGIVDQSGP